MKTIGPDYALRFHCIAGECRHSCCRGWEIDIDEESCQRYSETGGSLGKRLKESIVPQTEKEPAHFRMTADEKCPFLNGDGLCDLIVEKGEGMLCQICRDHPRFRNYFSDRDEMGLGLCCEEAARLILTNPEKPRLIQMDDDGETGTLTEDEQMLLDAREALTACLQDREKPIDIRLSDMLDLCEAEMPKRSIAGWATFFLSLERLDEEWAEDLTNAEKGTETKFPEGESWETALEQLAVYLLYRHLPGALNDGDLSGRVLFTVLCVRLIRQCFCADGKTGMDDLIGLCRRFSAEIEYSDVNEDAILDEIARLREEEAAPDTAD